MSSIITCSCGARIRLPEERGNRKFRCPKCKTGIALTAESEVLQAVRLAADRAGALCAICQAPVGAEEPVVTCPRCEQVYHRECWAEVGGCGTYGCRNAPAVEKEGPPADQPLSAWGDTKTCPACGETIKAIALRCRYCGTDFDTVDPLTVADLRWKVHRGEAARGLRKTVIVLFALSLIGLLAPIIAAVGAAVLLPKREQIAKEGPFFQVLAYSTIGLSVVYSLLMLLFILL